MSGVEIMPGDGVDGFKADPDGLRALARQLRDGLSEVAEMAPTAPPAPNAGASSSTVGAALAAILEATAGLVSRVQDTADKIDVTDGSYGDVDNQTATDFGRAGGG